jgi:hypothetical protein
MAKLSVLATVSLFAFIIPAAAQDAGTPTSEMLSGAYAGKAYSPYAQRTFPERPLWGETHLHTSLSMDAGGFGNRVGLRDAYRLARGEEIIASSGQPVRLSRPFDWLVITDHSDGMGFVTDILSASPLVTSYEQGARWSEGMRTGGQEAVEATLDLIGTFSQGKVNPELLANYSPGSRRYATIWDDVINAAEEFNEPGRFTALMGFEWTSLVNGGNMHRNVIFRDGGDRVRQVVPFTTQAPIGSTDPLELYKYLENYEAKTNGAALATATALCSRWMRNIPAASSTNSMSSSAQNGSGCTRSPRSRVTARRILSCRPMTNSPITAPGTLAIWIFPRRKPMTCSRANMRARR